MQIRVKITRTENPDCGQIVKMDIEDYLRGVVPAEMVASTYHEEALKAQAIASRTWAVYRINKNKSKGYDVDDTANCQAYRPHDRINPRSDTAVKKTSGMVITYNGKIIDAVFSNANGGRMVSAVHRWGTAVPYLVDKADPYDKSPRVDGHGVGMSQTGANYAAKSGLSYNSILDFYYPGTKLTTLYKLYNNTYSMEGEHRMTDYNKKLSENFRLREFFYPENYTNVRNKKTGKNYTVAEIEQITNGEFPISVKLLNLLEEFRTHVRNTFVGAVIYITPHGGYRPTTLNSAVGGAYGSQHRYGRAADFKVKLNATKYMDAPTLAVEMEKFMADHGYKGGVGMYKATDNYIHVDVRGSNVAWYDSYSSAGCPGQGGRPCTYRSGQKGAGVVLIQRKLNALGYDCGTPDGKYGAKTAVAVKKYQQANGLTADGVYGNGTNAKLLALPW